MYYLNSRAQQIKCITAHERYTPDDIVIGPEAEGQLGNQRFFRQFELIYIVSDEKDVVLACRATVRNL
jgi:hypothetical protein